MEEKNFKFDCSTFTSTELKQIREEVRRELEHREYAEKEKAWLAVVEAISNYGEEIEIYAGHGYFLGTLEVGGIGKMIVLDQ